MVGSFPKYTTPIDPRPSSLMISYRPSEGFTFRLSFLVLITTVPSGPVLNPAVPTHVLWARSGTGQAESPFSSLRCQPSIHLTSAPAWRSHEKVNHAAAVRMPRT